ncbi:HAD-IB family hydrolase [Spirillospora sp. NPDC050679]
MTAIAETYAREILRGPEGAEIGAFFDFDGTVLDGFSVNEFLLNRLRHAEVDPRGMARGLLNTSPLAAYRLAATAMRAETNDRNLQAVYDFALGLWAGRREEELAALGERVLREGLAGKLRRHAWTLIQAHRRMGHTVVLVSAATRYQVRPLAERLGIEHVLCSTLEVVDGRLTGRLAGPLLRGMAKSWALSDFAAEHGIDTALSHAYADTGDDVPFLKAVGNPCAVNPHRRLSRAAAEHNWPVLWMDSRPSSGPVAAVRSAAACGGVVTGMAAGLGTRLLGVDGRAAVEHGVLLASDLYLGLAGVRIEVQGAENLWARRPAVFVFNHQSVLDVPIVARLLERRYTGFAKAEVRRLPGIAQAARLMDMTFVDRRSPAQAREVLQAAAEHLARGVSLAIAPEGTRSLTPAPAPFKHGAFLIARRAGVPVVPIVIRNAGELMGRAARTVRAGRVEVRVHEPIDVASWKARDMRRHVEQVHRLYIDTLAGWADPPVRSGDRDDASRAPHATAVIDG